MLLHLEVDLFCILKVVFFFGGGVYISAIYKFKCHFLSKQYTT